MRLRRSLWHSLDHYMMGDEQYDKGTSDGLTAEERHDYPSKRRNEVARNVASANSPQSIAIREDTRNRAIVFRVGEGVRLATIRALNVHLDFVRFLYRDPRDFVDIVRYAANGGLMTLKRLFDRAMLAADAGLLIERKGRDGSVRRHPTQFELTEKGRRLLGRTDCTHGNARIIYEPMSRQEGLLYCPDCGLTLDPEGESR